MTKEECEIETSKAIMEMRNHITELEKEKCELLGIIQGKDKVIKDLEWQIKQILEDNESYQEENAELKAYNEKLLNGDIEKHNKIVELEEENSRLKQIILGNEMEIAAKNETIEELKKQVQGYLINYSDNTLVKVLRDCIIQNKKLSSQEQNQLSAWIECAMDFGTNLDECSIKLDKAKEIIKRLIKETYGEGWNYSLQVKVEAEKFLKESE